MNDDIIIIPCQIGDTPSPKVKETRREEEEEEEEVKKKRTNERTNDARGVAATFSVAVPPPPRSPSLDETMYKERVREYSKKCAWICVRARERERERERSFCVVGFFFSFSNE